MGCAYAISIAVIGLIFWGLTDSFFLGIIIALFVTFGVPAVFKAISDHIDESAKLDQLQKEEAEKAAQREREAFLKARQLHASDFNSKSAEITKQCESNLNNGKQFVLTPVYGSVDLQGKMWNALGEIFLDMQKLENTVAELSEDK